MNTTVRCGVLIALLVISVACGSSEPTSPTGTSQPPPLPSPTPSPPIEFPPLSGPSRTFIFDGELSYRVRDFTRNSRFVLYDNGAFLLEYPPSYGRFPGQYRDANGVLMFLFKFSGRTVDQGWEDAIGTLDGDSLTIRYHVLMQHADFEDAVYVRQPRSGLR